jgi:hypothetical protein
MVVRSEMPSKMFIPLKVMPLKNSELGAKSVELFEPKTIQHATGAPSLEPWTYFGSRSKILVGKVVEEKFYVPANFLPLLPLEATNSKHRLKI